MANAAQHAAIGAVAGAGTYLAMSQRCNRKKDLKEFFVCVIVGLLAASIPDLLEPASDPNHRRIAHSLTIGGLLAKIAVDKCGDSNQDWEDFHKILAGCAITGYLSHLVADGCTPRGLPLLHR